MIFGTKTKTNKIMTQKTMRKTALVKRLAKLKVNKNSFAYRVITSENKIIRPCHLQGSGKWTSIADHDFEIKSILDRLNLKYTWGNDAPKGGKVGLYIKIETK